VAIVRGQRRHPYGDHASIITVKSAVDSCSNRASLYRIISTKLSRKNCLLVKRSHFSVLV